MNTSENKLVRFGTVCVNEIVNPFDPLKGMKRSVTLDGRPLREYIDLDADIDAVVSLNGVIVYEWDEIVPCNSTIIISPYVAGGGGGSKNILATIAMIALVVVAPYAVGAMMGMSGTALGMGAGMALGGLSGAMVIGLNAAVMIGGSMLIQSAFKPDMPNLPALGGSGTQESKTYSWSGLQTSQQPNSPIPVLYGTAWVGGTVINKYITYDGTDEWLNMQIALCHGEIYQVDETDILINNSPFLNYSTQIIDDVPVKTAYLDFRDGAYDQTVMDGFGDTSVLTSIPVKVTQDNPVEQVTESSNIDKLEVVINFGQGLRTITNEGNNGRTKVEFKIAYALDGTDDWQDFYGVSDDAKKTGYVWRLTKFTSCFGIGCDAPESIVYDTDADFIDAWGSDPNNISTGFYGAVLLDGTYYNLHKITTEVYQELINTLSVTASSTQAYKKSYTTDVLAAGKYKIRVTRITADNLPINSRLFNDMYLSYVSEVNTEDINYGGIAMVGIRIKATDNLSGEPNFKFKVSRKPITINGAVKETSNPANAVLDMLTNRHYGAGIDVANIDINAFNEWSNFCFANMQPVKTLSWNTNDAVSVSASTISTEAGSLLVYLILRADALPSNITSMDIFENISLNISLNNGTFSATVTKNDIHTFAYVYNSTSKQNDFQITFKIYAPEATTALTTATVHDLSILMHDDTYFDTNMLKFNGVLDTQSNLWDSMQKVSKVGRGQMVIRGTKYSPVVDKPTQVTQLFNDANILDDSFSIAYLGVEDMASEIEIQYADNALNGEMNQINIIDTVVESGGLAPNKTTMQLIGATTQAQALTHGKYLLAQNKYIKRTMNFKASIDSIACTVGDVIGISNSIPEWGVGGRIEEIIGDEVVLDKEVTIVAGTLYKVRVRNSANDSISETIISKATTTTTDTLNIDTIANAGDIFSIGEVTISGSDDIIEARIIDISRDSEQTRSITAIEYNESILDFDYDNDLINIVSPKIKEDVSVFDINVSESLVKLQDGSVITRVAISWNSSAKSQTKYDIRLNWDTRRTLRRPLSPSSLTYGKPMNFTGIESTSYIFDYTEPIPAGGLTYNIYVSAEGSTTASEPFKYTIMGKLAAPEPVTGLTSHSSNGALMLSWDKSPEIDIAFYAIEINGQVNTSLTNSYVVNHLYVGTYDTTVRAVDTSDIQSEPVTISATLREPSDRWVLRDTALIEQAFLDGDLTIYFGIGADVSGAEAYDLWKVKVGNLTVDFLTYNSIELDTMSFENFNADVNEYAFFYYNPELTGTWTLCHAGQVELIQKLLGQVNATATDDGNVRIFNQLPFTPYSLGDLWLDGEDIYTCTVERLTGEYNEGDYDNPLSATSVTYIPTVDLPKANILSQPSVVVTNEQVGYVDNTGEVKSYIRADGSFKFHGDNSNYIEWNNSTLTVQGKIVVGSGSDVYTKAQVDSEINQAVIDANTIDYYYETYDPTLLNAPYSTWADDAERDTHIGDTFTNTVDGDTWRFIKNGTVYSWLSIPTDTVAQAAYSLAQGNEAALNDNMLRIFKAEPLYGEAYDVGDLWVEDDFVYQANTAKAKNVTTNTSHWDLIADKTSANTAASITNQGALATKSKASSDDVTFNYATSSSKGGNASDTDKVNNVASSTVQSNAETGYKLTTDDEGTTLHPSSVGETSLANIKNTNLDLDFTSNILALKNGTTEIVNKTIDKSTLGLSYDDGATVGASWSDNLTNVPARLTDDISVGLNLTPEYLGYATGTTVDSLKTYMANNGDFFLSGQNGTDGLVWDSATGTLSIAGSISITGSTSNVYTTTEIDENTSILNTSIDITKDANGAISLSGVGTSNAVTLSNNDVGLGNVLNSEQVRKDLDNAPTDILNSTVNITKDVGGGIKLSGVGTSNVVNVDSEDVTFNYSASNSKGGNALDTDKVNGVIASTITDAVTNFDGRNDRDGSAITPNPTIASDGTAIDHVLNDDGSATISLEWGWSGNYESIDGFLIFHYASEEATAKNLDALAINVLGGLTYSSTGVLDVVWDDFTGTSSFTAVPSNMRHFTLNSVVSNRYYTLGVCAYRYVDEDIDANRIIKTTVIQPSLTSENPYRPSSNVAFNGDVTGTIDGVSATTVKNNASSGATAYGYFNNGVLSSATKLPTDLSYITVGSTITMNATSPATTVNGLYLGSNKMGYVNGNPATLASWNSYIDSSGNFYLKGTDNGLSWDASTDTLTVDGTINSTSGSIGGWTLGADKLTGGNVSLKSSGEVRVDNGNNYVLMDSNGLRGYSDTLATTTFNIPTDGSSPTFSAGTITNVKYEVKESAVIEVGTNPTTDGVVLNSAGIKTYTGGNLTGDFGGADTALTLTNSAGTGLKISQNWNGKGLDIDCTSLSYMIGVNIDMTETAVPPPSAVSNLYGTRIEMNHITASYGSYIWLRDSSASLDNDTGNYGSLVQVDTKSSYGLYGYCTNENSIGVVGYSGNTTGSKGGIFIGMIGTDSRGLSSSTNSVSLKLSKNADTSSHSTSNRPTWTGGKATAIERLGMIQIDKDGQLWFHNGTEWKLVNLS